MRGPCTPSTRFELDVAGRRRAADEGQRPGRVEPGQHSGTVCTTWSARTTQTCTVGHQADRPPALVRGAVEDDRAGLGRRGRAGGDHGVDPSSCGRGREPSSVATVGVGGSQPRRQPGGTTTRRRRPGSAAATASATSGGRGGTVHRRPVVDQPVARAGRAAPAVAGRMLAGAAVVAGTVAPWALVARAPPGSGPAPPHGHPRVTSPARPRVRRHQSRNVSVGGAGQVAAAPSTPTAAAAATGSGRAGGRAAGPAAAARSAPPRSARDRPSTQAAAAIATASGVGTRRAARRPTCRRAQVHQHGRDVDAHRAGVEAGAAERWRRTAARRCPRRRSAAGDSTAPIGPG